VEHTRRDGSQPPRAGRYAETACMEWQAYVREVIDPSRPSVPYVVDDEDWK
jgi:hypothetical protein